MKAKKTLALLMSVVLSLSVFPGAVWAEEAPAEEPVPVSAPVPEQDSSAEPPSSPAEPSPTAEPPSEPAVEPAAEAVAAAPAAEPAADSPEGVPAAASTFAMTESIDLSVRGNSPAFGPDNTTIYNNNAQDDRDFSYSFPCYSQQQVNYALNFSVSNEYSDYGNDTGYYDVYYGWIYDRVTQEYTLDITKSGDLPEHTDFGLSGNFDGHIGALGIDTTIPYLRFLLEESSNPHPEMFNVTLSVGAYSVSGYDSEDVTLKLLDCHLPIERYEGPPDPDAPGITLTQSLDTGLTFSDQTPEITSVEGVWYSFFMTDTAPEDESWQMPLPLEPYDPENEMLNNLASYSYCDLFLYDPDELNEPMSRRFERYFGKGVNTWTVGRDENHNHGVRGPEKFIAGVAANKLTKTGTAVSDLNVSLSDFITPENIDYFNSLPGLSNGYSPSGYYTEEEYTQLQEECWSKGSDPPEYYYGISASLYCDVTITFSDGLVYTRGCEVLNGGIESTSFHVVGDLYELAPPVVPEPHYTMVVPESQEICSNMLENPIGYVGIQDCENFAEGACVVVTIEKEDAFTRTDGGEGTIPYMISHNGAGEKFLAGTLLNLGGVYCRPQSAELYDLSVYVRPEDWRTAADGEYTTTLTFTAQYTETAP